MDASKIQKPLVGFFPKTSGQTSRQAELSYFFLPNDLQLLGTLLALFLLPVVSLATALFDVVGRNDVVPPEHCIRFVAADHHGLLFRPAHLLDHVADGGSPKVMKQQFRLLRFFDGLFPRDTEFFDWGTGFVPSPTSTALQFRNDVAIDWVPEKYEFTIGVFSVSKSLLATEPVVHVAVDGRKDWDRLAVLFANEAD